VSKSNVRCAHSANLSLARETAESANASDTAMWEAYASATRVGPDDRVVFERETGSHAAPGWIAGSKGPRDARQWSSYRTEAFVRANTA
jgi:hypothetical protein